MGSGFAKKKKQARMMQEQFSRLQSEMANIETTGTAGGGLVTVVLTGEHEIKSIKLKPECVDKEDIEALEDLIKAAYNEASKKLSETTESAMPNLGQLF